MRATLGKIFTLAGAAVLFAVPVHAQATRTWVSGVGDDANPCSRTAPCKTFAGAISKTAAGGQINCIDSGGFGGLTITKSLAIQCDTVEAGVLVSGTSGIIVNTAATDTVFLSGLDIQGLGTGTNGINFVGGGRLHVRNTVIRGFTTNGITFAPTGAAKLVIQDSVIADNPNSTGTGGGVLIKPAAGINTSATLTNVHLDRNKFGLRAEDRSTVIVSNCTASGNAANGILAASTVSPAEISVMGTTIAGNGVNGVATSGTLASIFLSNSSVFGNVFGVNATTGGTISGTSPQTNTIVGNTNNGVLNGTVNLQ